MSADTPSAPDTAKARLAAGIAAYRQGSLAAAAAHFSAVLELDPGQRAARVNLANAHWALGDFQAAETAAALAREADPASAEAWIITGAIRLDRGDPEGAAEAYAKAVRLSPDHAAAQAGLAAAYLAQGRNEAAIAAALRSLGLAPDHPHALFTLASARLARHEAKAALALFDALLAISPGHARARHNRANALIDLGRLEEAKAELLASVALDPGLKEAWATLGYLHTIEADLPAALASCDRAIALDPEFAVARWNKSVALLLDGDFAAGFAAYEWRKRHPRFRHHFTPLPGLPWQGEPLAGRHLLVRAEQGFGDTIMLARFLPGLAAEAARVTLCCPPTLFALFRGLGIGLVPLDAPATISDFTVDQMSLPHLLGITETSIPGAAGYLTADPRACGAVLPLLPEGRPRIGLVWAGNPMHDNDHHRSLPPGALAPLLALPGVHFVSLQFGPRAGEYPVADPTPHIQDYGDTAAILRALDGVVSVDSSVAHLAGALGVPCDVLISKACDWRWRLGRSDTAWYASLTLHRQTRLDDWSGPVESVASALRQRFGLTA